MRGSFHSVFAPRAMAPLLRLFSQGQNGLLLLPQPHPDYPQYIENTGITAAGPDQVAGFVTDRSQGGFGNLGANQFVSPHDFTHADWSAVNGTIGVQTFTFTEQNGRLLQRFDDAPQNILTQGVSFWRQTTTIRRVSGNTQMDFGVIAGGLGTLVTPITISDSFQTFQRIQFLSAADIANAINYFPHIIRDPNTAGHGAVEMQPPTWRQILGNHAHQPTSANRPLLKQDGNLWYWQFDGSDDSLSVPGLVLSQPYTVIIALTVASVNQSFVDGVSASNRGRVGLSANGNMLMFAGSTLTGPPITLPSNRFLFTAIFDGANSVMRYNGATVEVGSAGPNTLNGVAIGKNESGGIQHHNGNNYGVFIRSGNMLTSELHNLERAERALAKLAGIEL